MTAFIAVSVVMIAEAAAPATILSNQQGHRLGAVIQARADQWSSRWRLKVKPGPEPSAYRSNNSPAWRKLRAM